MDKDIEKTIDEMSAEVKRLVGIIPVAVNTLSLSYLITSYLTGYVMNGPAGAGKAMVAAIEVIIDRTGMGPIGNAVKAAHREKTSGQGN